MDKIVTNPEHPLYSVKDRLERIKESQEAIADLNEFLNFEFSSASLDDKLNDTWITEDELNSRLDHLIEWYSL